jgi:peroxiredoxin
MIFPNFQLENNDNSLFDFYAFAEEEPALVIFFRGAWCRHCQHELQDFQTHTAELNTLGVKVVAISSDTKLKSSLLKTFLKLDFSVLSDANFNLIDRLNLKTKYKEQIVSKPALYFIAREKEILFEIVSDSYDDRPSAASVVQRIKKLVTA